MAEEKGVYIVRRRSRAMDEGVLDRLLVVFTGEQVERIVELAEELCRRTGYGEVVIVFRNRHPEFLRLEVQAKIDGLGKTPFE